VTCDWCGVPDMLIKYSFYLTIGIFVLIGFFTFSNWILHASINPGNPLYCWGKGTGFTGTVDGYPNFDNYDNFKKACNDVNGQHECTGVCWGLCHCRIK
jgi:hypothetical protein